MVRLGDTVVLNEEVSINNQRVVQKYWGKKGKVIKVSKAPWGIYDTHTVKIDFGALGISKDLFRNRFKRVEGSVHNWEV